MGAKNLMFYALGNTSKSTGIWNGLTASFGHYFDQKLASAMYQFFIEESSIKIYDMGCGVNTKYVNFLNQKGLSCTGFDGNPSIKNADNCYLKELHVEFNDEPAEWVISLETGDKIPRQYEKTFIDNLKNHATKGIILSWAKKGQAGSSHLNGRNKEYLINKFCSDNSFYLDVEATNNLRKSVSPTRFWLAENLLVFRKTNHEKHLPAGACNVENY